MSENDYKPLEIKFYNNSGEYDSRLLIDGCQLESAIEMAQKESNGRKAEVWTRNTPYHDVEEICLWES
jgi:hypothetical protein